MVNASEMVKSLNLTELSPPPSPYLNIETSDINRPGLQLAGFWEHFAHERPQILGLVETSYLNSLDAKTREERLRQFVSYDLPCIIICRRIEGMDDLIALAAEQHIPVYRSEIDTTRLVLEMIFFLNNHLAPHTNVHGVLVDVYGVGILITGESGIGKSESALELVKRGHRLVADDAVDVRRINEKRLVGEAPKILRHLMEIRGVGIIDIANMFGIGAVVQSKSIDLVVRMENWQEGKEYDRVGLQDEYTEILDVRVPFLLLPIRPGRNLAIVLEVAARNLRLKQQGYNAARELDRRMSERLRQSAEENSDLMEQSDSRSEQEQRSDSI